MVHVLATETHEYLVSLRHQLVRLAPRYFEDMAQIIDSVARGFRQWSQQPPSDQLGEMKKTVAADLAQRQQQFWLGCAGWLIHGIDRGWTTEDVVVERWDVITSKPASLSDAYEAWKRLSENDPYQWDHEADQERKAALR